MVDTLGFPLISLSPYNDSFMFGKKLNHSDGENAFLRSFDKGKTSEFISDTLLPANVSFDVDSKTVFIIDVLSTPVPEINCEINTCNYGLFINEYRGSTEDWELKQIFPSSVNTPSFPKILTHPTQSGKLYVWNADSVLVTEDFVESFKVWVDPSEEITGFTATPSGEYYTTTSKLYEMKGDNSVELFSIPVSNELEVEFPEQFELLQNYPNPFNHVTTITYRMRTAGIVSIELYTIQGQWVRELVNDFKTEGQHSFRLNGSDLASGIYILRGKMGVQTETRKITLIK